MSNQLGTYKLPILQTNKIPFLELNNVWSEDKRYPETAIQKFILRNTQILDFLDIATVGEYFDNKYFLKLTTSKYIGCVPILSPKTGLPCGNLIVTGRFGEDISELLSVIGQFVEPEFCDKYKLGIGSYIKPPLYFECQNFIDQYIEAKKYKWRKFENIEIIQSRPKSSTNWDKYAERNYDPKNTFKYPNKCNILSKNHKEWQELNYVLDLSINEILSTRTPKRSRAAYISKITSLQNTYDRASLSIVNEIKPHMSDPIVIKKLKAVGNRVLQNNSSSQNAWRLDFAEFFERFVQYLMTEVAKTKGARIKCNPHFNISGQRPNWALKYIEPDIILDKDECQYIIDAKYKAHMYEVNGDGDLLRDTFRSDFHQVLAYSSFGGAKKKNVMLIYPSDYFVSRELNAFSSINGYSCKAILVGIPLKKSELDNTQKNLAQLITM